MFDNLLPGVYTFTETSIPANYTLAMPSCDLGTNAPATTSIAVTLAAGEDVTCTFVNTLRTPKLTVVKVELSTDTTQTFDFSVTDPSAFDTFILEGSSDSRVVPNTINGSAYTVTETNTANPSGQLATFTTIFSCVDDDTLGVIDSGTNTTVTLPDLNGRSVTCTFTNSDVPLDPMVTVTKIVVNAAGTDDGVFTLTVNDPMITAVNSTAGGNGTSVGPVTVTAGQTVTISESVTTRALSDYTSTIQCGKPALGNDNIVETATGTPGEWTIPMLVAGETVVCEITNMRKVAQLQIVKDQVGGAAVDWDLDATGPTAFTGATANGDGMTTAQTVLPGTYTVAETGAGVVSGNFVSTFSCTGGGFTTVADSGTSTPVTLAAGDDVVCTFTNTKNGTIEIVKDPGAADGTSVFSGLGGFSINTAVANMATFDVVPGSYTATEIVPAGWVLTGIACVETGGMSDSTDAGATATIELQAGETVTCTFTNEKRPTLEIEKGTLPGGLGPFGFDLAINGNPADGMPGVADFMLSDTQVLRITDGGNELQNGIPIEIVELSLVGVEPVSISCVDTSTNLPPGPGESMVVVDVAAGMLTVTLMGNQDLSCAFGNEQQTTTTTPPPPTTALPPSAPEPPPGEFSVPISPTGSTLTKFGGSTVAELLALLEASGATSATFTVDGETTTLIVTQLEFVNDPFFDVFFDIDVSVDAVPGGWRASLTWLSRHAR